MEKNKNENEKGKKNLKGFEKHITSAHAAFLVGTIKKKRDKSGQTFHHVVSRVQNNHQKWLETTFHSIRYLAANGLPFRDDNEHLNLEGEVSGGLFLNTLQHLVFQLQPELANIFKRLPRNAKYLTSDIQTEFIEILANMVQEKHAAAIRKRELWPMGQRTRTMKKFKV